MSNETNEVEAVDDLITETNFVGGIMSCVVDILKASPRTWQELSEADQDAYLKQMDFRIQAIARKAINTINAAGRETLVAEVDSVTFKDGVKCVLKVPFLNQAVHALADSQGDHVTIVISGAEGLIDQGADGKPTADPDQPEMGFENEEAEAEAADEEDEAEPANEEVGTEASNEEVETETVDEQ